MNRILQIILLSSLINAYPDMQNIPPEVLERMPPEMKEKMGLDEESADYETIQEFLEDGEYETSEGFLKLHKNIEDDEYFLELSEEDLNKEFIYFAYSMNAPQAAGTRGGALGDGSILEFRRFKDGLSLHKKNTYFSNETDNNIGKADLTNVFEAFLDKFEIVVEEDGRIIISVNDLFVSETLSAVSPNLPRQYREFIDLDLGRLDSSKTFINQVRNYPKNTAVEVTYGFANATPNQRSAVYAVADARFTSIVARHLFVEMPDDNFEPRVADQRVGYFSQRVTDMSTYDNYPQRDLINKWRLIKKDPSAELSEPVKPIVFLG